MNQPEWLHQEKIRNRFDARPIIANGEHPLQHVFDTSDCYESGDIFELTTPFSPTPMIEKMESRGFNVYSETPETGIFLTYFHKM